MADHNDPNAVNSIFSDIDVSAADLYDLFGFPSADTDGGEKVLIALTFSSVPSVGAFDTDMLYRILISPDPRVVEPAEDEHNLKGLLRYFEALKEKFLGPSKASEIRVTIDESQRATIKFINFPGASFSTVIDTNQVRETSALGLQTSFDHDNSPVSVHKTYSLVTRAFSRAKKTLFQRLNMPDDTWNPKVLNIPLRRPFEIFVPNVCAIDMDTTGT